MTTKTVDPTSAGEDGYIEENEVASGPHRTVAKKYLALHVPNFSHDLHSFLCLGADTQWQVDSAAAGTKTSIHGDGLAKMVLGFCDDDRSIYADATLPTARGTLESESATQAPVQSVDDHGSGHPTDAPGVVTNSKWNAMQNESALLHSKGGWRDHSDGNRISTTYGDKIEIIRGNYKLLVLGRQDDPAKQVAGWDVSGGLVSTDETALNYPPVDAKSHDVLPDYSGGQQLLNTQYTWEQDSDGNWAWTMATVTGAYSPAKPDQGNGRIVSYTWVDQLMTYVGSGALTADGPVASAPRPVKVIDERTWGESINQEIHAVQAVAPPATGDGSIAGFTATTPSLTTTITSDGDYTTSTTVTGNQTINLTAKGPTAVTNDYGSWKLCGEAMALWGASVAVSVGVTIGESQLSDAIGQGSDMAPGGVCSEAGGDGPPAGYDQGIPTVDGSLDSDGNPTAAGYFSTGKAWTKNIVGMVGKLGPTIAGFADGGLITDALDQTTHILGAASYKTYTFGTNSATRFTLGSLSDTDLTLGQRSSTKVTLGIDTDFKIGVLSSSIKLSLKSSEFNVAVLNADNTTFAATSLTNDLTARVINQAPTLVANLLSITWGIVAENKVHVSKNHLASMHTFAALMHMLF